MPEPQMSSLRVLSFGSLVTPATFCLCTLKRDGQVGGSQSDGQEAAAESGGAVDAAVVNAGAASVDVDLDVADMAMSTSSACRRGMRRRRPRRR